MPRLIIDLPEDKEFEKSVQNAYEAMAKRVVRNAVDKAMEEEMGRVVEGRIKSYLEGYGNTKLNRIMDTAMSNALRIEITRVVEKCSIDEELIRKSAEKVYEEKLKNDMRFREEGVEDYLCRKVNEIIENGFAEKLKEMLPGAVKAAFNSMK